MDECPGDSSVSASPRGPPWRPERPRFQLRRSPHCPPPRPPLTLRCLFTRRAPGHRKRPFPERSGGGRRGRPFGVQAPLSFQVSAAPTLVTTGGFAPGLWQERARPPPPGRLQPWERGSGQSLTWGGVWERGSSRLRVAPVRGCRQTKSAPKPASCRKPRVEETQDVCACGAGVSEGCICFFQQVPNKSLRGTAGRTPAEAAEAVAAAWAAPLVCCWRRPPGRPCVRTRWFLQAEREALVLCFSLLRGKVLCLPKCRRSQAARLLGPLGQADPAAPPAGKAQAFSVSARHFPVWNEGELIQSLSQFGLHLFSWFGMQGGNYCGLLPCKRSINFVPIWGEGPPE